MGWRPGLVRRRQYTTQAQTESTKTQKTHKEEGIFANEIEERLPNCAPRRVQNFQRKFGAQFVRSVQKFRNLKIQAIFFFRHWPPKGPRLRLCCCYAPFNPKHLTSYFSGPGSHFHCDLYSLDQEQHRKNGAMVRQNSRVKSVAYFKVKRQITRKIMAVSNFTSILKNCKYFIQ